MWRGGPGAGGGGFRLHRCMGLAMRVVPVWAMVRVVGEGGGVGDGGGWEMQQRHLDGYETITRRYLGRGSVYIPQQKYSDIDKDDRRITGILNTSMIFS